MPKRKVVAVPRAGGPQSIEIVSYGRKTPGAQTTFSPAQLDQIARTVRGVPEVTVKVSGGARDVGGAIAHFSYIDRHGRLAIETDEGLSLEGRDAATELTSDWNLDLYEYRAQSRVRERRPKLVHNIVLSMPAPTLAQAVLRASRKFAREHFAYQYRYAMVLHTDQKHPHVHLVVKAEHEYQPGARLNIRKATLRLWREHFAQYLREEGIAANATARPLRGLGKWQKKDAIHHRLRARQAYEALSDEEKAKRKAPAPSTLMQRKLDSIGKELRVGKLVAEPGKEKLIQMRARVVSDWQETAAQLRAQGHDALAEEVERFVARMPPVRTEKEHIATALLQHVKRQRDNVEAASQYKDIDPPQQAR